MTLPPIWDVKTHYALEDVRTAATALQQVPDTEAAKAALMAVRAAAIKAYACINEAEIAARKAALASIRTFA